MEIPRRTSDRLSSISVAEPLWTGIGMFVMYLIMNGIVLFLTFRTVAGQIPDHLTETYAQIFSVMFINHDIGEHWAKS